MGRNLSRQEMYDLEELMDKTSLTDVIDALITICYEKSEHVRSDWQDEYLARTWDKDADVLQRANVKIQN